MSDILKNIEDLPEISFIDNLTLDDLLQSMITDYINKYTELTGSKLTLAKADPNQLIIYSCATQLYQAFQYIDRAGKRNLLKYSYGEYLDNLAALKGVTRNNAQPAVTTIRFTLSSERISVIPIPVGTRVAAGDIYFESIEYAEIAIGSLFVDVSMVCTGVGIIGNNFVVGEINILVDPIPYIESVSNLTISSGGSEIETDLRLAERVYLAPSSFSVAGPDDAYVYWAKTYSQEIEDVNVTSPEPGKVDIRILLNNGRLPDENMIQGLDEFLNDKKIKPLTDYVTVSAPDVVSYNIEIRYWINRSRLSQTTTIQSNIVATVDSYVKWQSEKIGRDINPSELIKLVMSAGAKRIDVISPLYTEISNIDVAQIGSIDIVYGGVEND